MRRVVNSPQWDGCAQVFNNAAATTTNKKLHYYSTSAKKTVQRSAPCDLQSSYSIVTFKTKTTHLKTWISHHTLRRLKNPNQPIPTIKQSGK